MSKFKVGDRVEVLEMPYSECVGKVGDLGTVIADHGGCYGVDFDNQVTGEPSGPGWTMIDRQLKLVELQKKPLKSKPEIIFMDDNRLKIVFAPPYTIVEYKHRSINFKARSTCNPEDTYDKFEGFRLAAERLKVRMKKEGYAVKF